MKKRTLWLTMTCLMGGLLLLASCAPSTPSRGEGGPPPEGPPEYGGTITMLTAYTGLEHLSFDHADIQWMHNFTAGPYQESLVMGDLSKGRRGTNEWVFNNQAWIPNEYLTGALAESWELETDPLRLVFHIRQGVMWQDKPGVMEARELTAEDVKFSWERTVSSPRAIPKYYDWIDSFEAPDRYTFVVNMNEYNANWGYLIGWGYYTLISPPELAEEDEDGKPKVKDWKNACGTGPFMLTDYTKGTSTTYERNPNYWGTTTIDGEEYQIPFVDKMVWPIIPDESTQIAALRSAQVDIDAVVRFKYKDSLEQTNPELQRREVVGRGLKTCIAMRVDKEPYDDQRVRRALNMAVDKQGMIDTMLQGHGILVNCPFSQDWELYTPMEELPDSCRELFTYNPEKAKELLADAGYPDGFKSELIFSQVNPDAVDKATMAAANLANIGVDVELKPMEYGRFIGTMFSRNFDHMYMVGHGEGNPFSILRKAFATDQTWNPGMWSDPSFDNKLFEARAEMDEAKRNEAVKELNLYAMENGPYIMLPTTNFYTYAWPWVGNWYGAANIGAVNGSGGAARYWLDLEKKEAMGY